MKVGEFVVLDPILYKTTELVTYSDMWYPASYYHPHPVWFGIENKEVVEWLLKETYSDQQYNEGAYNQYNEGDYSKIEDIKIPVLYVHNLKEGVVPFGRLFRYRVSLKGTPDGNGRCPYISSFVAVEPNCVIGRQAGDYKKMREGYVRLHKYNVVLPYGLELKLQIKESTSSLPMLQRMYIEQTRGELPKLHCVEGAVESFYDGVSLWRWNTEQRLVRLDLQNYSRDKAMQWSLGQAISVEVLLEKCRECVDLSYTLRSLVWQAQIMENKSLGNYLTKQLWLLTGG